MQRPIYELDLASAVVMVKYFLLNDVWADII